MTSETQGWKHEVRRGTFLKERSRGMRMEGPVGQHSLRISAVAYLGIMESVVSSGCRMQPWV